MIVADFQLDFFCWGELYSSSRSWICDLATMLGEEVFFKKTSPQKHGEKWWIYIPWDQFFRNKITHKNISKVILWRKHLNPKGFFEHPPVVVGQITESKTNLVIYPGTIRQKSIPHHPCML